MSEDWNERRATADPLLCEWIQQKQFHPVCSWDFRRSSHINLQELKAANVVAKRLGRRPSCWGLRYVFLVDSEVCQGALMRGRSSSRRLNHLKRGVLPYTLLTQIRFLVEGVPAELNPADDGTRRVKLRSPRPEDPAVARVVRQAAERQPRALRVATQLGSGR